MIVGVELDSSHQISMPLQYVYTFFCSCAMNFNKVTRDTEDIPGNKKKISRILYIAFFFFTVHETSFSLATKVSFKTNNFQNYILKTVCYVFTYHALFL